MAINPSEWIWLNDKWVRWNEATVHVTAHALHYGSSAFEGIRAYETSTGPAVFRLGDHLQRLLNTCKILRMQINGFDLPRLEEICLELVARNQHRACYIRPIVFRNTGSLGVDGSACSVGVAIFSMEWGRYLGAEAIEQGVDAAVSSWRRFTPGSMAPLGKIGGQYINNQFASVEAKDNGFAEAILLDHGGFVCEGGGENLFVVVNGEIITPPMAQSILVGITRDTVLRLADDLGYKVRFESIPREMLYVCDELFLTGTAAEITPVRSVDRVPVGEGRSGPVTRRLQEEFFGLVSGEIKDRHGWLTPVPMLPMAAIGG